jgi:hypothetical protein
MNMKWNPSLGANDCVVPHTPVSIQSLTSLPRKARLKVARSTMLG